MKRIYILSGSALLILIVAMMIWYVLLSNSVQNGIEKSIPEMLGTEVTIKSVNANPLTGNICIKGFVLANPEGFSENTLFRAESITLDLSPLWVWQQLVDVNEIVIKSPEIHYEITLRGNNSRMVQKQLQEHIDNPDKPNNSVRYMIRKFKMTGSRVTIGDEPVTKETPRTSLPDIVLQDIGLAEKGKTLDEVSLEIVKIADERLSELEETGLTGKLDKFRNRLEDSIDHLFQ